MKLTPHILYRFAEVIQALEQLTSVTGTHPPRITTEVILDDQPNAFLEINWIDETDETIGHFAITGIQFVEEEPAETDDAAAAQEILERFMKNFPGLGENIQVVNADTFFAAPEDSTDEELIAQAPVAEDEA